MSQTAAFTMTSYRVFDEINNLRPPSASKLFYQNFITKLSKLEKQANFPGIDKLEYRGSDNASFTVYRMEKAAFRRMIDKESPKVLEALIKWWNREEANPAMTVSKPSVAILTRASKAMGYEILLMSEGEGKTSTHFHKDVISAVYG